MRTLSAYLIFRLVVVAVGLATIVADMMREADASRSSRLSLHSLQLPFFCRVATPPRPKRQLNDLQITSHVKGKLASDVGASSMANIDLNTTNGVVTLAGEVENAELKHSAEAATASVLGVVMVSNNLQVGSDSASVDY